MLGRARCGRCFLLGSAGRPTRPAPRADPARPTARSPPRRGAAESLPLGRSRSSDDRGRLLYGRNADRLFVPASTAKVFVSAVAAARLPADGTVRTSVYATGPGVRRRRPGRPRALRSRRSHHGPPLLRRGHDAGRSPARPMPRAPLRRLGGLAQGARHPGDRRATWWATGAGSSPRWCTRRGRAYDLNWWYAAPVSGLGFNDNSVDISWSPGLVGEPARISFCAEAGRRDAREPDARHPRRHGDHARLLPRSRARAGSAPKAGCRKASAGGTEHFALPDPNLYAAWAFAAALADAGVAVRGTVRSTTDSTAYRAARGTAAPGRSRVPSVPRLDLPHPEQQSELVRRDAAQAARPPLRARGLVGRGPRGRTAVPRGLGRSRLDPDRAGGRLGARVARPGEPARAGWPAPVRPPAPGHGAIPGGAATVGLAWLAAAAGSSAPASRAGSRRSPGASRG